MKEKSPAKKSCLAGGLIILLALCFSSLASAQEADTWQNEITIYGWLAGIDGTLKYPQLSESDVEIDASDILEDLNMVFMGGYQGHYNRWSIIADVVYMDVGDSGSTNVRVGTASAGLDIKSWILSAGVGYDLVQDDWGLVTAVGGVRYLGLDVEADLAVNAHQFEGISGSEGLTDGIIGLSGYFRLGDNWYLPYHADIGAGGSDLSYQLFAAIGYRFGWGDIRLGYRYLYYDLGDDKLMQDLALSGPVLGAGFRF